LQTLLQPQSILIGIAFFLPIASPPLFGWLSGLLAVPVFFTLRATGERANILIRNGLLLAGCGALVVRRLEMIFFVLSLVALAYGLHRSARRGDDPAVAGGKGVLILGGAWLLFWTTYGLAVSINPYTHLVTSLDGAFGQIDALYSQSSEIPAETVLQIRMIIEEIRAFIPRLLPGLLAATVIMTVWLNQTLGNGLLLRYCPARAAWPPYGRWRLPERLVWLVIGGATMVLVGQGTIKDTGLWILLVSGLLYLFQGLALFVYFLEKWRMPIYLRLLLYTILAIQSYGLLLLAVFGLADTWLDVRKLSKNTDKELP